MARFTASERNSAILGSREMARNTALGFRRHCTAETAELTAEAELALVQAADAYDPDFTVMPWGAYANQRIVWRLRYYLRAGRRHDRVVLLREMRDPTSYHRAPLLEEEVPAPDTTERDFDRLMGEECVALVESYLDARQKKILHMRYTEQRSLVEISVILGMRAARVRQINHEAMLALRHVLNLGVKLPPLRKHAMDTCLEKFNQKRDAVAV